MEDVLQFWRDYIDLTPANHVCCASAYTNREKKHNSGDWLKPYLLMYDKIFVDEVGSLIYNAETTDLADTYQWLLDERLIDQYPRCIYREINDIELSEDSQSLLFAREKVLDEAAATDEFDEERFRAVAARWEAAVLADFCSTNATCLERSFFNVAHTIPGASAMRIIVEEFPVPVWDMPFQDIIALRSDETLMAKRAPLRNWCRKIDGLPDASIRDEFSAQLEDYKQYMKLQNIKCQKSVLEICVTTPIGIVSDILRLDFDNVFGRLFKLADARIALAEAELKAPSRELAFLMEVSKGLPLY
ncbi:uncharacterized protein (DUF924 family) [Rhizobium sp. BK316]|uniref:hypothetical protein n=1 Tax=Rhizobium sp. BK316 TaxID=2587053 RepID=UPI0016220C9A|nr:hypothetical protein [Rhizobium sp. BK316]MBB3411918.1 uncharacterized protein (DUF924 family) [Rhizobium sp. BK316]